MIFDSDILIWVSRGEAAAEEFVRSQTERAASVITLMELFAGARSKAELATTRGFFIDLDIKLIPISEQISFAAAILLEDHCLADGLSITDALIAATARESAETLATANFRHFRKIPNLSLHAFRPRR